MHLQFLDAVHAAANLEVQRKLILAVFVYEGLLSHFEGIFNGF
jgi:hypothetical protein